MKYSLRSLTIVLALVPPLIAAVWYFTFDMSPHDKSATAQLLLLCIAGVAVLAAVWRVGVAARSRS
jgi:hypothetical protein